MSVYAFPIPYDDNRSTVHVMGNSKEDFEIGHESRSGSSWGSFSGPYSTGAEAIAAAYALNRDTYDSDCNVVICDEALADQRAQADRQRQNREEF